MKKLLLLVLGFSLAALAMGAVVSGPINPGGGSGATTLNSLTDVNDTGRQTNYALLYNGTEWVAAAQGTTFSFGVSSFSDGIASTLLIGNGLWKAAGSISFASAYSNGPATSASISYAGWTTLTLTAPYTSIVSAQDVAYPASPGSISFTLSASKSAESASSSITHTFYNYRFWGTSTLSTGFSESDIEALSGSELSNSISKTFSVTAAAGEYIVYAYPSRLGTATFTVGGFAGGFAAPQVVSVTNSAGFNENYYLYRSVNTGLGATTVVAQ